MNLPKFSVVIPTRNEAGNLSGLVNYIKLFDEIIFIDGASTDGTPEMILKMFPKARLIRQGNKIGKGAALCLGLLNSSGDVTIILDADAPVSVNEVLNMMEIFRNNDSVDLVKTSRHLNGGGSEDLTGIRKVGTLFFASITRFLFRVKWTEMCYGFWGIKNKRLPLLNLLSILNSGRSKYPFQKIPYGSSFEFDQLVFLKSHKLNFSIMEIPSIELERQNGQSNLFAPFDGLRTLLTICRERFRSD
jgi:glycosyltransferase involved in cell wall biosynthesis